MYTFSLDKLILFSFLHINTFYYKFITIVDNNTLFTEKNSKKGIYLLILNLLFAIIHVTKVIVLRIISQIHTLVDEYLSIVFLIVLILHRR